MDFVYRLCCGSCIPWVKWNSRQKLNTVTRDGSAEKNIPLRHCEQSEQREQCERREQLGRNVESICDTVTPSATDGVHGSGLMNEVEASGLTGEPGSGLMDEMEASGLTGEPGSGLANEEQECSEKKPDPTWIWVDDIPTINLP